MPVTVYNQKQHILYFVWPTVLTERVELWIRVTL